MTKKILLTGAFASVLFAQTSAFDAGNVNLAQPYGLTENEKVLLENKKKVETLSKDYTGVDFKTNKALERIDGIQSVVESLNDKTHNYETKLLELEKFTNSNSENIDKEIKQIKAQLYKHEKSITQLQKALNELTNLIESMSKTKLENNVNTTKQEDTKLKPNLSSSEKLNQAIKMYENKNYVEAFNLFDNLLSIKHKPALCNFYLGQISYEQKKYKDAIYYYKTSTNLYKNQGVKNPNLALVLLNTANSLKALNQNAQANNFYKALKTQFPNSKEAKSIK